MRSDTPSYSRMPMAVRFALMLLWTSLAISVIAFLYNVVAALSHTPQYGAQPRWLVFQVVVFLVINGFLAVICRSLGLARNWARGALFGMVLLETAFYLLILLTVGTLLGPPRTPLSWINVVAIVAYGLRAVGLLLVMIPGRHWFTA